MLAVARHPRQQDCIQLDEVVLRLTSIVNVFSNATYENEHHLFLPQEPFRTPGPPDRLERVPCFLTFFAVVIIEESKTLVTVVQDLSSGSPDVAVYLSSSWMHAMGVGY